MALRHHWPLPLFLLSVGFLWSVALWVVTTTHFAVQTDLLATAITVDLVVGIPLLGYLCFVRTRRASPLILVPLLLVGFGLSYLTLPAHGRSFWYQLAALLPLLEGGVLLIVTVTVIRIVRASRQDPTEAKLYLSDALASGVTRVLGPSLAVRLLTLELTLLALTLGGWFWRYRPRQAHHQVFSVHRSGGYRTMVTALTLLTVVEVGVIHLALSQWNLVVAWVVTGVSIYSLWWVLGDFQAIRLHPSVCDGHTLHLRAGLRWRMTIPLHQIAAIHPGRTWKPAPGRLNMAVMGQPDLVLDLREPVPAYGLLGRQQAVQQVGFSVDDPAALRAALSPAHLITHTTQ